MMSPQIFYRPGEPALNSMQPGRRKRRRHFRNRVGVARQEKHLSSALIDALKKKRKKSDNVVVASELDCFQGVADVVAGVRNGYRLFPDTAKRKLTPVNFSTAKVLSALAGRKCSNVEKISRTTGLSAPTIRKQLALLRDLQMLRFRKDGRVSIPHEIRPPFKEIVAFEVKVKDWKSGIYQARNYKSFAHKVSVARPLKRAELLKERLDDFRRMRVGLVGITAKGELEWLLRPRREKPISGPRNFLAAVNLLRRAKR